MTSEQEWEQVLQIKTAGRDDSRSDTEHHPYEPTDYCVLERLANSGHIRKKHTLIDYGSGKGRVSIFMAYQTGCHSIGIEYDERLYEKALLNGESPAARNRVSFVHGDAALYELPAQADREVENFLNNHVRLEQEEPIDCSDLFEEKDVKERILVYSVNLF